LGAIPKKKNICRLRKAEHKTERKGKMANQKVEILASFGHEHAKQLIEFLVDLGFSVTAEGDEDLDTGFSRWRIEGETGE